MNRGVARRLTALIGVGVLFLKSPCLESEAWNDGLGREKAYCSSGGSIWLFEGPGCCAIVSTRIRVTGKLEPERGAVVMVEAEMDMEMGRVAGPKPQQLDQAGAAGTGRACPR